MEIHDKQLIRIAADVQAQLQKHRTACFDESNRLSYLVTADLDRLKNLRRAIETCRRRHWLASSEKLTNRVLRIIRDLPPLLDAWERTIQKEQAKLPTLRELVEDLYQIQQEFGRLEINRAEATLSVFTDPIVLQDVYLGDFEIRLHYDSLAYLREADAFRIIALDPHCPAGNDLVTHPHVSDEYLCMGDATTAIYCALSSGRLCDAILLVKSVLETYNSASPYVSLNQWEGYPCNECGDGVVEDEVCFCDHCEYEYCSSCFDSCNCCQTGRCRGCLNTCDYCEEIVCSSCLASCEECGESCCKDCLTETYCPTCNDERNLENEEETNETETIEIEQHVA